ncbi:MAG: PRC-barrel domain-containing protein [Pseudomonadota bacterium]
MLTRLLATTAIAGLLSTGAAIAQADMKPVFDSDVSIEAPAATDGFFAADSENRILASNLIGATIYTSAAEQGEAIGDVNDVILSPNGDVIAAIVGVGGFVGIGEKDVAVEFSKLSYQTGENGERWLTGEFTQESLEAVPEFDRAVFASTDREMSAANELETGAQEMMQTATEPMETDNEMVVAEGATEQLVPTIELDMENDLMVPMTSAEISADTMLGYSVMGIDGDRIGEIDDFILNAEGNIDAVIVDVGGFFGIGEKEVALGFNELQIMRESADAEWSAIQVAATEEQLKDLPEWNAETYKSDPDAVVYRPAM